MMNFFFAILFKVIYCLIQMVLALQTLLNDFIRYVYLPLFYSLANSHKIVNDIKRLLKVPSQQVTFVVEVTASKPHDLQRTVLTIKRYCSFVEDSIAPTVINCYFSTQFLNMEQKKQFRMLVSSVLQKSQLKIVYEANWASQSLCIQKSKLTPLVLIFSSYPCISGLPAYFLVGAEVSFNPPITKSTDHDLLLAFQQYAASQQRKGK